MAQEARIVQIDFSAAFDMVNHQGILVQLCSVGVGGSVLSVPTQFLSNRSQCGACHMAYILTFYIFLPSLDNNTIFIFSSYFI